MRIIRRSLCVIIALLLALGLSTPGLEAKAETSEKKTVRVGFITDMDAMMTRDEATGIMSGYGYEYLQMIANYTGWDYYYEFGDWYTLWSMLQSGEIDALVDVSYTEERAEKILFPNLDFPMGKEVYRLYASKTNIPFDPANLKESLDNRTIGVSIDTLQALLTQEKVEELGSNCQVKVYNSDVTRNAAFNKGEIDFVVDAEYSAQEDWDALYELGSSNCYLAFAQGREDLVEDYDEAVSLLDTVNPTYTDNLYDQYFSKGLVNTRLTTLEQEWVANHSEIRVGYIEAESDTDSYTEKILTNLLKEIKEKLGVDQLKMSFTKYEDYNEMKTALDNERIDLIYPVLANSCEAEQNNLAILTTVDQVDLKIVMQKGDKLENMTSFAVCAGSMVSNYVYENYADLYQITEYSEATSCLTAVAEERVDVAIVLSSGLENELNSSSTYENLAAYDVEDTVYRSLACSRDNTAFYALMTRGINLLDSDYIKTLVNRYNSIETDFSIRSYLVRNIYQVIVSLILLVILVLAVIILVSRKKAVRLQRLSQTDSLTGIYNRSAEAKIRKLMENGEEGLFILFDVDHFKAYNDTYGHDGGDEVLVAIAKTMQKEFSDKDIVLRLGGDEFAVYITGLIDYATACEKLQQFIGEIEELRLDKVNGEIINVSIGASFWMKRNMVPFNVLYKNADSGCYESKKTEGSAFTFR